MSNIYRLGVLALAGAAFGLCLMVPWHPDTQVRSAAAIVAGVLVLWISEVAPLGVTAMLVPVAATATGIFTWREALSSWASPIIFLFLGAFMLARALDKHGAFGFLERAVWLERYRRSDGVMLSLLVMILAGVISTLQNNTATTAMLLPAVLRVSRDCRWPCLPLLALSYGATFGGMATPVGTAPNLIGYGAMQRLGDPINFVSWLRVGVPVWLGVTLIAVGVLSVARLVLRARPRGDGAATRAVYLERLGEALARADERTGAEENAEEEGRRTGLRWALAALGVTVSVWVVTGIIAGLSAADDPTAVWVRRYLPESLVPVTVGVLLFTVRVGRRGRTVLSQRDFQGLDWNTLFLIAGGLCLGRALEETGAARALAEQVAGLGLSPLMLMLALGGVTILLSDIISNTATAALIVPIAASVAPAVGADAAAMVWLVALVASLGFALPISTPPNAIVYGTGAVPLRVMLLSGVCVDALGLVWVVGWVYVVE